MMEDSKNCEEKKRGELVGIVFSSVASKYDFVNNMVIFLYEEAVGRKVSKLSKETSIAFIECVNR